MREERTAARRGEALSALPARFGTASAIPGFLRGALHRCCVTDSESGRTKASGLSIRLQRLPLLASGTQMRRLRLVIGWDPPAADDAHVNATSVTPEEEVMKKMKKRLQEAFRRRRRRRKRQFQTGGITTHSNRCRHAPTASSPAMRRATTSPSWPRSCDETGVPDGACLARVRTADSVQASRPPASSACRQRLFRSRGHGPQVDHRSPMTRASFGTACPSASSETPA